MAPCPTAPLAAPSSATATTSSSSPKAKLCSGATASSKSITPTSNLKRLPPGVTIPPRSWKISKLLPCHPHERTATKSPPQDATTARLCPPDRRLPLRAAHHRSHGGVAERHHRRPPRKRKG